ncbi:Hop-interacting protein [Pelomyxa schiedti]|nr:Hop-interacting protein [Pelomyxa schiedti]
MSDNQPADNDDDNSTNEATPTRGATSAAAGTGEEDGGGTHQQGDEEGHAQRDYGSAVGGGSTADGGDCDTGGAPETPTAACDGGTGSSSPNTNTNTNTDDAQPRRPHQKRSGARRTPPPPPPPRPAHFPSSGALCASTAATTGTELCAGVPHRGSSESPGAGRRSRRHSEPQLQSTLPTTVDVLAAAMSAAAAASGSAKSDEDPSDQGAADGEPEKEGAQTEESQSQMGESGSATPSTSRHHHHKLHHKKTKETRQPISADDAQSTSPHGDSETVSTSDQVDSETGPTSDHSEPKASDTTSPSDASKVSDSGSSDVASDCINSSGDRHELTASTSGSLKVHRKLIYTTRSINLVGKSYPKEGSEIKLASSPPSMPSPKASASTSLSPIPTAPDFTIPASADDEHRKLRNELEQFSPETAEYKAKLSEYRKALAARKKIEEEELRNMAGSCEKLAENLRFLRGEWKGRQVAIKHYSEDNLVFDIKEFRKEIALMRYQPSIPVATLTLDRRMTDMSAINFAMDIAKGMAFLHSLGLIHRDLKTYAKLFGTVQPYFTFLTASQLTEEMIIKIIDFGTTRVADVAALMSANIGTVQYMAPELFDNEKYTQKADVYAYAIVLWEMMTREEPFAGKPSWSLPNMVKRGERPAIPKAMLTNPVAKLIIKCWNANAHKRPSFSDISNQLLKLLQGEDEGKSSSLKWGSGLFSSQVDITNFKVLPPSIRFNIEGPFPMAVPHILRFDILSTATVKSNYFIENLTDPNCLITFVKSTGVVPPRGSVSVEAKLILRAPLNKQIQVPIQIGKSSIALDIIIKSRGAAVFNVDPSSLSLVEDGGQTVPEVLVILKEALFQNQGLSMENVFIQPGSSEAVHRLREAVNKGDFALEQPVDPLDIADLLKVWFHSMPEGLLDEIPLSLISPAPSTSSNPTPSPLTTPSDDHRSPLSTSKINQITSQLKSLNSSILHWLAEVLTAVAANSATNGSSPQSLAHSFSTNLFLSDTHGLLGTGHIEEWTTHLLESLIQHRLSAGPPYIGSVVEATVDSNNEGDSNSVTTSTTTTMSVTVEEGS